MADRENREDWHERSLRALGRAVRGEDETATQPASLLSVADRAKPSWQDDAAARHRLARSRREAKPNPLLSALAEAELDPTAAEHVPNERSRPADAPHRDDSSGLARLLPGWLRPKSVKDGDSAIDEAVSVQPPAERVRKQEPVPVRPQEIKEARRPVVSDPETPGDVGAYYQGEPDQQWKPLIDPMKVVGGVARSKLLIATTTILGAALGVAIAISSPKKYEATTELIVDPRDLKLTDRDLTQSVVASDATLAIVENQVRVLTSGTVLNKVVDKLNLVNDPEFNGEGSGGLGVMSLIRSVLSRNDGPGGIDEGRRHALAVGNLAESLSVERGGKTFVITVSVTTQNGEKSALIANTMTDVFLQTFGEIQSDTAGRASSELTARLDELRKGVEAAERKVEDFRATHDLVDAQGHLISDDELLKLNEQLSIARAHTLELNARAASARSLNVDSVLGGTLPEEINSSTMSELRAQYATLKQADDSAAIRLGPRHPERLALDAQLAGARDRIAAELRRIGSSLQTDLKRAVQLEQELASRLAQLKVRAGDVNSDLVTLRELEREANAKRAVYEAYLLRAKETGEQKDINTANINVISKAFAPLEANGPSRAVVALAGLLLGFASGVGLGAMRGAYESLRDTANARSGRRKANDRRELLEDKTSEPAPEPVAATPPPAAEGHASPVGALLSAVRKAMPRKAPPAPEPDSSQPVSPAVAETAKPMEDPVYPVYPEPTSPFAPTQSAPAGYQQPQFQPAGYAPPQSYPQQPVQPGFPPQMMPQAMYPSPQGYAPGHPYPQPYPYAHSQAAYPPAQPWQMQPMPAAYPYPQPAQPYAPQAASTYPQQPLQQQPMTPQQFGQGQSPEARQAASADQQTPIEEIRASLREFRDAVRELTESRTRRRYF